MWAEVRYNFMTKYNIQYLIAQRQIKKDPEALCLYDEATRSNKKVVTYATNLDRYTIRFASEKLLNDLSYVFKTQGKDPKKLEDLLMQYPEIETSKLRSIVDVYHNPFDFTEFPDEYFEDKRFVNACKISIAQRVKEELGSKINATRFDINWAENVLEMVDDTIRLHNLTYKKTSVNYESTQVKNSIIRDIKKPVQLATERTK